jgi:hypothetical protein
MTSSERPDRAAGAGAPGQESGRPVGTPGSQVDPGTDASTETAGHVQDRESQPPAGSATGSSGGYGVGSDRSSGGSGEPTADENDGRATSAEDQTDWLRRADGGPTSS